ncbi:hypothetical protein Oweho_1357 [Owenweeksia hongkongensis DSM 17368]|uniref:Uncharacterized protein n=1 Tax=Owenweeksia hongkongensis (strain DSM 17368 / CIP 108786 / JCM 12287 / NRRL B-23963 / UST20020801) TaxID=926562 RepID=G8R7K1_OWEHD|nr:DUF6364 family protein [Owenweeksia hongkongensis]AEV32354.1 hypothetical protein Oweho_1357 [Owenweeksia hongkongensis DSM 17368]
MQTKLTLSIDQEIIDRAKEYAKQQGVSLSKLVQEFLTQKAKPQTEEVEVPEELEGVFGAFKVPDDFDYKKEKAKRLIEKYNSLG